MSFARDEPLPDFWIDGNLEKMLAPPRWGLRMQVAMFLASFRRGRNRNN
jgi:hypothetical protein